MIVAFSSLSILLASLALVSAAPHEQPHGLVKKSHHGAAAHHHQKRVNGRATWYDVGLGACGDYNGPGDYIVALNSNQLDTSVYPPVQCNRKLRISYQGKSAVATVKDECPGCPYGALDMSKGLFTHFEPLGTGEFYMEWEWVDGSSSNDNNNNDNNNNDKTTTTTKAKPKTTTTTTTTTRRTTTTTRSTTTTTTTTKSSSSSSSSSSSTTSTTTSSSASASATPGNDNGNDQSGDTVSNIANQQQFIANLGYMSSIGRSS